MVSWVVLRFKVLLLFLLLLLFCCFYVVVFMFAFSVVVVAVGFAVYAVLVIPACNWAVLLMGFMFGVVLRDILLYFLIPASPGQVWPVEVTCIIVRSHLVIIKKIGVLTMKSLHYKCIVVINELVIENWRSLVPQTGVFSLRKHRLNLCTL